MLWDNFEPKAHQPLAEKYDNEVITKDNGFKKGLGSFPVNRNIDLLEFYKKMIHLRDDNKCLQEGDINFLYSNDEKQSFAFERVLDDSKIIITFNIGKEEDDFEVPVNILKGQYKEIMTNEEGTFSGSDKASSKILIKIPAQSVRIYKLYKSY